MKLYEINAAIAAFGEIENFVDTETGEILNQEAIDKLRSDEYKNLKMSRHDKLENIALLGKQSGADAAVVYNEMKNLRARYKAYKATEDWCKRTLGDNLEDGEVLETPRVRVSHRKSESVEIQDVKAVPDEYLIPQEPKVDKAGLKKVLKQGAVINGVQLVVKDNIQLK